MRSVVKGNCRNLIENLLKNDAVERLPMKPGGVKNLTQHKWFAEHDWDALSSQVVEGWKGGIFSGPNLAVKESFFGAQPQKLDL